MSIAVSLEKLEPQPWMAYRNPKRRQFSGDCCPILITGQRCDVDTIEVEYGALYNWYAATDVREITSAGWHVPTKAEFDTLKTYLGGAAVAGGKLKEIGTTYWDVPNTGATNETDFNGRGSGQRHFSIGGFGSLNQMSQFWCSDTLGGEGKIARLNYDSEALAPTVGTLTLDYKAGIAVRPIKDSTILSHGETGTYTGNDGKVYNTICIGTQEWLADNLCETEYRDGTPIPEVTDSGDWTALVTGAMSYYDNDIDNAFIGAEGCGIALLPFQIISNGAYVKTEISPYGEDSWTEITVLVTEVMVDGNYIISYAGEVIEGLTCGSFEIRVTAGELWWFEPIHILDFEIVTNTLSRRADIFQPFPFFEAEYFTDYIMTFQHNEILPFMFRTTNPTTSPAVYVLDCDDNATLLELDLKVSTICGYTYYYFDGCPLIEIACNDCGYWRLKIVDGDYSYYSVPFTYKVNLFDCNDAQMADLDADRKVVYDDNGDILCQDKCVESIPAGSITADTTVITADTTIVTADGGVL